MKAQTISTIIALAAGLQQVAATSGWNEFPPFTCPGNSRDACNPDQQGGYDFSDLSLGDFSAYKSFGFSGFSCQNSPSKRTGSGFGGGGKCITATVHPEPEKCPSFKASSVGSFTVHEVHVRPEFDVELEFHYGMSDGSVCKQKEPCSKDGTVIQNKQCGGAKEVTVVYVNPPKEKPTCSIEIHSIAFNCPTTSTTSAKVVTSTTSTTTSLSTAPAAVTTSSTTSVSTKAPAAATTSSTTSNAPVVPPTTSTSTSASAQLTTFATSTKSTTSTTSTTLTTSISSAPSVLVPPTAPSSSTASNVAPPPKNATTSTTSVVVIIASSSAPAPPAAASSSSSSSSSSGTTITVAAATASTTSPTTAPPAASVTTVIVETTLTTCPVTNTIVTGGSTSIQVTQTVSTITTTRTATVCDKCSQATSAPPPPPQETAPVPALLPSCLSTWMSLVTDCKSNDDSACYCPNTDFTVLVFGCLSAHGASDDEVYAAQQFFQGICAEHVSTNPAIITAAPTVTLTSTAPAAAQVTTIQILTTVFVSCTESNGPASTAKVISSAVTVPQVIFTTIAGSSVGLVAGTPTAPPPTPAGAPSTLATVAPTKAAGSSANTTTPSSPKFTGAASRSTAAFSVIGAAVAFAFFAL